MVGWDLFHHKIKELKRAAKQWEINKKKKLKEELIVIKEQMRSIYISFKDRAPEYHDHEQIQRLAARE